MAKKTKPTTTEPTDKTNKILVSVILDRSGSMRGTRANTISGYNEYIQGLRADKTSEYAITLIQFDAPMASPELTVTYQDRALADVPELTEADYSPRGNTPLYDAIGECVRRTDAKDRGVIVLIITDGHENASTEFTREAIKALIKEKETAGWTFAFLGANIDSYAVSSSIGVSAQNVSNYAAGNERSMYANMSRSTVMRSGQIQAKGARASTMMSFFDNSQRQEMEAKPKPSTGGRPAVPATFQPAPRTKRDWTVKS